MVESTRSEVSSSVPYLYNVEGDPLTYNNAMASHDSAFWKKAIDDEMQSIMGNNIWVLMDLPPTCKPIGCKWIFQKHMKIDGTIDKFKARLVAQGFIQKLGIDHFDTYAPVARITTIRLLVAFATIYHLEIHQMDVKTAFLYGEIDEEVYMKQPEGFVLEDKSKRCVNLLFSFMDLNNHLSNGIMKKFCPLDSN